MKEGIWMPKAVPDDKIEVAHRLLSEIDDMRGHDDEELPDTMLLEAKLDVVLAGIHHVHEQVVP